MHGRTDEPAGQGKLVKTSKILFAGFEFLTLLLKGVATRKGRKHGYRKGLDQGKVGHQSPIVPSHLQ